MTPMTHECSRWAHLKRDFKSISEAKGKLGSIGKELCALRKTIFISKGQGINLRLLGGIVFSLSFPLCCCWV